MNENDLEQGTGEVIRTSVSACFSPPPVCQFWHVLASTPRQRNQLFMLFIACEAILSDRLTEPWEPMCPMSTIPRDGFRDGVLGKVIRAHASTASARAHASARTHARTRARSHARAHPRTLAR
eukprot:5624471-Alexandrium_andersonii.AAC.1